jgi:hypothetical protein
LKIGRRAGQGGRNRLCSIRATARQRKQQNGSG